MLTYHVVPRFDISAAEGGGLYLGAVIANLKTLTPLNRGPFRVPVPADLLYPTTIQHDFSDTLRQVRRLNFSAWCRSLLPVSAAVEFESSNELEQGITCDGIVTTYFDDTPGDEYTRKCLDVGSVHNYLKQAGRATDLYVVTGLKVATNLKFNQSIDKARGGKIEVAGTEPTTATTAGVKGEITTQRATHLQFSTSDIVIGYRIKKWHCTRKLFSKDETRTMKDKGILEGNMQGYSGPTGAAEEFELVTEPRAVEGEQAAQADAPNELTECWVGIDQEPVKTQMSQEKH